jgi:hypothetical protein
VNCGCICLMKWAFRPGRLLRHTGLVLLIMLTSMLASCS